MKHIFIFNGDKATGKTLLSKLLNTNDTIVEDNFWFYDPTKNDYQRDKIKSIIDNLETPKQVKFKDDIVYSNNLVIICQESRIHIRFLTEFIKDYYRVFEKEQPLISYVKFSRV